MDVKFKYKATTSAYYDDVQEWCWQNIGKFGESWTRLGADPAAGIMGGPTHDYYFFANESDAMLFKLRWPQ